MTRVKKAVASRKRRKRILKRAKGFVGDRKNHVRLSQDAVMKAMAFATEHRRKKKTFFRRIWIQRISVAAKSHGISYSRLIDGLVKAGSLVNRKMLSELAIHQPTTFAECVDQAKKALAAA
ncbi:50S ribosomal protein L20 [Candidatus Aerophobetes bacterium]|uniref:Large ribosomal subunit protein bL20 n=1 Tax=Aerophobetes bacterium TaxID=2030807 RepID=A0A2A4WYL5_UNCAE|nr:MAG: 50S ribosomal protein L20 [Candidatus Aerophobetes bacterium]